MTQPQQCSCCATSPSASTVPKWSANCLAAQPDLAPCVVRREFADQSLGKVVITYALDAGATLTATEIILPGFAAAANVCFRAVTMTSDAVPVEVSVVRLAPVRLFREPDGSWSTARGDWESEQTSLASATTGRCACNVVCTSCVPPTLGWLVRLEHESLTGGVGGDEITVTLEYKATAVAPCCDISLRCGEPLVTPVAYGDNPKYVPILAA